MKGVGEAQILVTVLGGERNRDLNHTNSSDGSDEDSTHGALSGSDCVYSAHTSQ